MCMGLCLHQGVSEEDKKARGHSSEIEQALSDEQANLETNVVKILLLGECWQAEKVIINTFFFSRALSGQMISLQVLLKAERVRSSNR